MMLGILLRRKKYSKTLSVLLATSIVALGLGLMLL